MFEKRKCVENFTSIMWSSAWLVWKRDKRPEMCSIEMLAVDQLCEHDKVRIHTEVKKEMRTGCRESKDCWHWIRGVS